MDAIDGKIVDILQNDASLTNIELSERVNLSPSSCLRRVQRLKDQGILLKTVALADPEKLNRSLRAIVDVTLERHGADARQTFIEKLILEPAVSQAYGVTGETDVLLIMNLADMKEYREICDKLFTHDPNIVKFRTLFAMECHKYETAIPINVA
jgi:Lrp/AsnC family leucine-responsive transcriptional regulator